MDAGAQLLQIIRSHGIEAHDVRSRMPRRGRYWTGIGLSWAYTAVHYTAAWRERDTLEREIQSWINHANYHVHTHGWPAIAYAIGITPSGRVLLMRDLEEMGYHAFNANEIALAVSCDTAEGQEPTPEMLQALNVVLYVLHNETPFLPNLVRSKTYGHKEFAWYDYRNASTLCPGSRLTPLVAGYRGGKDFAPKEIPEREKKPDHAKILVPGIGEKWVIKEIFKRWSEPSGNVLLYGYPLTGMFGWNFGQGEEEVQVFERAIMTHRPGTWPEKWDVHLMHCGKIVAGARYDLGSGPFARIKPFENSPSHRYFPETGHSLSHGFKSYWEQYGDLDRFGFPISEEFQEGSRIVQYFERSRFEWHPGSDPKHYDVVLGRVGAEAAAILWPNGTPA